MANGIKRKCDFCNEPAVFDVETHLGPHAYVCERHVHIDNVRNPKYIEPVICEKKECSICGKLKSLDDFYSYTDTRNVERLRNECKACNLAQRKLNTAYKRKRKQEGNNTNG